MSGQQLDLSQQVSIILPLGAWNTVLNLIAKGPWEISDPLMQALRTQIANSQQPTRILRPRAVEPESEAS